MATEGAAADGPPIADEMVDELLPGQLDWQRLVRTYPLTSTSLAVVAGAWLGYRKGPSITSGLAAFAGSQLADAMSRSLRDVE